MNTLSRATARILPIVLGVTLLFLVASIAACSGNTQSGNSGTVATSSPTAPSMETTPTLGNSSNGASEYITALNFMGKDIVTNETISLAQYRGSVVLLTFVNYGCSQGTSNIVAKQVGAVQELRSERTDFVPISVFCGCCNPDVLRDWANENGFNWPWIIDKQNSIMSAGYQQYVGQYGYPTLVVIDSAQGVRQVSGYADVATLSDMIDNALKS